MSELKDPAIKLFGMTIPLLANEQASAATATRATTHFHADDDDDGDGDGDQEQELELEQQQQQSSSHRNLLSSSTSSSPRDRRGDAQLDSKKPSGGELTEARQEDGISQPIAEEINDPAASRENTKTPSVDKEPTSPKVSNNDEQNVDGISQDKTLKKPDKILPCPRCNSMDTKFCYYNNYNVNQPRHFCKNCQRYWTAGGTMRNVPVGSGRRKNKSCAASHYRHILVSEALEAAQADAANGLHRPTLRTNGTVLNFVSDAPLYEPMTSSSNLADKSQNCAQSCFHGCEQKISLSCGGQENGDDNSSKSSITASDSADKGGNSVMQESVMTNFQALPPQIPCLPAPPWSSPWNPPQWRAAMPPPPTFGPSVFPITFYPAPPPPYWGCTLPGSWNVPWLSPPSSSPVCSGPNSQILGKHSREGEMTKPSNSDNEQPSKEDNTERRIWVPKTLRIDDPSEAAKSSIWSTLGIKNEKSGSINGGGLFKAFQTKGGGGKGTSETSLLLQANPAALSRSLHFQESV